MVRKPRIWFPGAMYHIMCRGNHKGEIFWDDQDRQYYRSIIKQVKVSHSFELHAYCLMDNHVHLHIETRDIEIGKIMKRINMLYAIFYNHKYQSVGHLFQGRYKSVLIKDDAHHLQITRYIHLNPVRAKISPRPEDYPWSSYRDFIGDNAECALVNIEKTLNYFNEPRVDGYKDYLESELKLIEASP